MQDMFWMLFLYVYNLDSILYEINKILFPPHPFLLNHVSPSTQGVI